LFFSSRDSSFGFCLDSSYSRRFLSDSDLSSDDWSCCCFCSHRSTSFLSILIEWEEVSSWCFWINLLKSEMNEAWLMCPSLGINSVEIRMDSISFLYEVDTVRHTLVIPFSCLFPLQWLSRPVPFTFHNGPSHLLLFPCSDWLFFVAIPRGPQCSSTPLQL